MNGNFYIETYGCTSNQNDSEIIAGLLERAGFISVSVIEHADIVIVNTCIVKHKTENRIRHRITELINRYKGKKFIIAGCMPEAEYEIVKDIAPSAALISTNRLHDIVTVVKDVLDGNRAEALGSLQEAKTGMPKLRSSRVVEKIEVCSGCNFACAFCATKNAKGRLFSYPKDDIVREINASHKAGFKEFWITGQDVAAYNDKTLPELIKKIIQEVKGKYFLRLGMMHPKSVLPVLDQLTEVYKDKHVFNFLHVPVQSGSNSVLKSMKRGHTVEDFQKIVDSFRKAIPDITIWTDIIVGFPGETDEDFHSTLELLKKTKPDFVNVSCYGVRPYTAASRMRHIPTDIKKERTKEISKLADELALAANERWVNWNGFVIVDEYNREKKNWLGRNHAYKLIALQGNHKMGEFTEVKVKDAAITHLKSF